MTPPKCLPWEWTMVGKRGQKRALSLRYPSRNWKINQKHKKVWKTSKSWKVKKWQKSTKLKKWQNQEKWKMQKWEKCKIRKVKKWQKWSKKWPPLKMAKMSLKWSKSTLCEIRAAWSGVFWVPGGTTGPGFKAGFRPPLFLMFFDTFFIICVIFILCILWILMILMAWEKWHFWWSAYFGVIAIRPYYITIRGRVMYVWWFSPHFCYKDVCVHQVGFVSCRGDYTG